MITKKGFNVFIVFLVLVSSKVANGCFSENLVEEIPVKTGDPFLKICHCVTQGYSAHNIRWIDPHGNIVEPLSTNSLETQNSRPLDSSNDKLQVVEETVKNLEQRTGTPAKAYTETNARNRYVSLHIDKMAQSLSGPYVCETNFEGNKYTQTYNVEAHDSLYFVNTAKNQNVVIGEESLVSCEPRGNTDYMVTWHLLKNEFTELKIDNDDKYNVTANGLIIRNASKDDEGRYKCTATDTSTGEMQDEEIFIEVWEKPIIYKLKASPGNIVHEETNLTVQCIADGKPYPEYSWRKIADLRGNPTQDQNVTWEVVANTIVFTEILKADAGTYTCEAENAAGSYEMNITIEVRITPEIIELNNVTAVEGSMTQIVCKTIGEPTPAVILTYSGMEGLKNDTSITYEIRHNENGSDLYVTFNNVSRTYAGEYSCNATNEVDTAIMDMYFTVFYKPYFVEEVETIWGWNGKSINMSCEYDSNPPATAIWRYQGNDIRQVTTADQVEMNKFILGQLNNANQFNLVVDKNTLYGFYECIAKNEYGEAKKTIHLREAIAPAAIKNVTDISKTATSVTFHIEGPEVMDSPPVLGFVAQYDLAENYNTTSIHLNRSWSLDRKFIIERLKSNSTYIIKFAATNEAGTGVWSGFYEFDTPESSVPEPPSWDDSQPGNLRWKSSEPNGDPIDYYIIEYCPFSDQIINYSLCREEKVAANDFSLNKLDRNKMYSIKIRAHNSHGYSDYSYVEIITPAELVGTSVLPAGAIIGLSIVVVFVCLLLLDLLLLCWRRQGVIASCYFKNNKKKDDNLQSRDKKGLLVREGDTRADGDLTSNNGHREYEYNKTTGIITGKHSTV